MLFFFPRKFFNDLITNQKKWKLEKIEIENLETFTIWTEIDQNCLYQKSDWNSVSLLSMIVVSHFNYFKLP